MAIVVVIAKVVVVAVVIVIVLVVVIVLVGVVVVVKFCPGVVNANWGRWPGSGLVNTIKGLGPVNATLLPELVNTCWGQGW